MDLTQNMEKHSYDALKLVARQHPSQGDQWMIDGSLYTVDFVKKKEEEFIRGDGSKGINICVSYVVLCDNDGIPMIYNSLFDVIVKDTLLITFNDR